jgi:hypothetical protein
MAGKPTQYSRQGDLESPELHSQSEGFKSVSAVPSKPVVFKHGLRLFRITRLKDGKNISGVGKVIDGVQFENGQVVVCWKSRTSSLGIFASMEDFIQVHAKPFFKENEFEWVDGFDPDQQLNVILDHLANYVLRQKVGIKDKTRGNIVSEIIALKRHNARAANPITYHRTSVGVNDLVATDREASDV